MELSLVIDDGRANTILRNQFCITSVVFTQRSTTHKMGPRKRKRKVNIDKIMYAVHYLLKSTNTPIQEISDNHLKKLALDLKISRKAIKDAIAETQPTVKLKW